MALWRKTLLDMIENLRHQRGSDVQSAAAHCTGTVLPTEHRRLGVWVSPFNTNGDTIVARRTGPQEPQRAVELELTHEAPLSTNRKYIAAFSSPKDYTKGIT